MSRYIDADETLEQIRKKLGVKSLDYLLEAERQIVDAIQSAPSIYIVFCKECKLGGTEDCPMDEIDDEYFCNFGEREGE